MPSMPLFFLRRLLCQSPGNPGNTTKCGECSGHAEEVEWCCFCVFRRNISNNPLCRTWAEVRSCINLYQPTVLDRNGNGSLCFSFKMREVSDAASAVRRGLCMCVCSIKLEIVESTGGANNNQQFQKRDPNQIPKTHFWEFGFRLCAFFMGEKKKRWKSMKTRTILQVAASRSDFSVTRHLTSMVSRSHGGVKKRRFVLKMSKHQWDNWIKTFFGVPCDAFWLINMIHNTTRD